MRWVVVSCEELESLSVAVWETLTDEVEAPLGDPPPAGPDDLRAEVSIAGPWRGFVDVRLSPARARRLAARLFGPDTPGGADDLRDSVLELANIVGGNAKALLPGPCDLSVPRPVPAVGEADGVERRVVAIGPASDPLVVRLVRVA